MSSPTTSQSGTFTEQLNEFITTSTLTDSWEIGEETHERIEGMETAHQSMLSKLTLAKRFVEESKPVNKEKVSRIISGTKAVNKIYTDNMTLLLERLSEANNRFWDEVEGMVITECAPNISDYNQIVSEIQFSPPQESGDTSSNPNTDSLIIWDSTRDEPLPSTGHRSTSYSVACVFPIESVTIRVKTVLHYTGTHIVTTRRPEFCHPLSKPYKDSSSEDDDDEFFDASDYIESNNQDIDSTTKDKRSQHIDKGMDTESPPNLFYDNQSVSESHNITSIEDETGTLNVSRHHIQEINNSFAGVFIPINATSDFLKSKTTTNPWIGENSETTDTRSGIRNHTNPELPPRRSRNSPPDHYRHYNKVRHKDVHQTNTWNRSELEGNKTTTPLLISSIHRLFHTTPRDVNHISGLTKYNAPIESENTNNEPVIVYGSRRPILRRGV